MPEGDTIYRAARALAKALVGRVVTGFETNLAPIARVNDDSPVVGRVVERVESRGKWCLIFFSGDLILVTHMLMSGSWHIYRPREKWWMGRSRMRVAIRVGVESAKAKLASDEQRAVSDELDLTDAGEGGAAGEMRGSLHSALRAPVEMTADGGRAPVEVTARDKQRQEQGPQQIPFGNDNQERQKQKQIPLRQAQGRLFGNDNQAGQEQKQIGFGSDNQRDGGDGGYEAVAFNVPIVEFHTARSLERSGQVPKLGPDLFSGEFTVAGGVARMEAYGVEHPEAEVGVVLLNQRVLAGLGNVYKSEVAFAAGVNPFRQMGTVTGREREQMVEFAVRWMKANVNDGSGSSTGGDGIVTYAGNRRTTHSSNRADRLWVYGRQGQECRRCGATVMMRKQGEQARSTYWCPGCQAWVAGEGQTGEAPVGGAFGSRRRKVGC